jgi:Fe-S oxidoreductase
MACIQCGACVSDCLSMEVDPLFIGPAALAKAYRFVGDPRDAQQRERLKDLAEDPHGMYDCTHCFKCIEACPKGVSPMNQIMRLRRRAGGDHHIDELNLYISGYDEDDNGAKEPNVSAVVGGGEDGAMASAPGASPRGKV